jgi:glycosyltransferase involved in cell wall biosynthesis
VRILALYPFLPYPVVSGAALRGCTVLDILAPRHQVTLASFAGRDDSPAELPTWKTYPLLAQQPIIVARQLDEQLTPQAARLRALRPRSSFYVPEGLKFFDVPAMWNRIASLDLSQFDAVHVRFLSMASYALALQRAEPRLRLVIDLDDNPSLLLYRKLRKEKMRPRELGWQLRELTRLFAFELRELRNFQSVWICSTIDHKRMARRIGSARVLVVENVVDADKLASIDRRNIEPAILMIGDFNYAPNKDGACFFVSQVWPAIRTQLPGTQLWFVGKNSNPQMLEWNGKDGITVTGMVDDVKQYLARAMVSIAPLFVGTGTKLKILEALAAGVPVVTTTLGAEGIDATNGVDILLADTAREFALHCLRLLEDRAERERLTQAGQALIRQKYDISVMSRSVLHCYDQLEPGNA